jgi:hypothetical protein
MLGAYVKKPAKRAYLFRMTHDSLITPAICRVSSDTYHPGYLLGVAD